MTWLRSSPAMSGAASDKRQVAGRTCRAVFDYGPARPALSVIAMLIGRYAALPGSGSSIVMNASENSGGPACGPLAVGTRGTFARRT